MLAQSYPIISGAVDVLKDISSDEDLRFRAEREVLARLDQIDWEATIREEAREEAFDEGIKIGEQRGEQRGEQKSEGKWRQQERIDTVLRMHRKNKSIQDILDAVDLPRAEVEEIIGHK